MLILFNHGFGHRWAGILFNSTMAFIILQILSTGCEARGGGSKRTFGSQKSQGPQNLEGNCSDPTSCKVDPSDPSWQSALGATMALVGPLLVLLTFIAVIKFCIPNAYPKGYHKTTTISATREEDKPVSQTPRGKLGRIIEEEA